jgi:UDP-2,3-diacylglucosamine pyrophosphatase LpxH
MSGVGRSVFIISDLHIGGAYPLPTSSDALQKRGFRMMTNPGALAAFIRRVAGDRPSGRSHELVINGDFVDFLAEQHGGAERWRPFLYEPTVARETFEQVAARDGDSEIFDALKEFVATGQTLTILVGNHDVELSLPAVRAALLSRIGATGASSVRFVFDGEALKYGGALVEHGNLYDPANVVDHSSLLKLRTLQSRGFPGDVEGVFKPPPGSQLVASVMNPLKAEYAFIDLLKPESEPLFALLLALDPSCKKRLGELALSLRRMPKNLVPKFGLPTYLQNVADDDGSSSGFEEAIAGSDTEDPEERALRLVMAEALGQAEAGGMIQDGKAALAAELPAGAGSPGPFEEGVADFRARWTARLGLLGLFVADRQPALDVRLRMVQRSLRALEGDLTFDDKQETGKRYLEAATRLCDAAGPGNRIVVFGHTHHAKDIQLEGGGRYLNTGTWANLMRFPQELLGKNASTAKDALKTFVEKLAVNDLGDYIKFRPTYVRLDLDGRGATVAAELLTYDYKQDRL